MKKIVLNMEPFSCPSCIKKIEGTLTRMDGVEEVKVLFHSGKVRVLFDASKVRAEDLENAVTKLGYPVLSKKVS